MTSLPVEDGFFIQCIQNDSLCRCLLCNAVFMGLCQVFKKDKKKKNVKRVDTIPAFMEVNVVSFSSLILIFALLIAS